MSDFNSFGLSPEILAAVKDMGYERPTTVQEQIIPAAMAGKDILGRSQTGTGKTASFGLPTLNKLLNGPKGKLRLIVVAPTRELAAQVHSELLKMAKHTKLRGVLVIGGESFENQEHEIRFGVDWIVGAPGRLRDHLSRNYMSLERIETLILDEADRLLELGFMEDIEYIASTLPPLRQTMLFSATLPLQILELADQILNKPERIDVGEATSADNLEEVIYPVSHLQKFELLQALLQKSEIRQSIIFARTKQRAERLWDRLERSGIKSAILHADREMHERVAALKALKEGEHRILIATDLAARGLDISGVSHVINYDTPVAPEDYIHRVGRTGRAGAAGVAWTFVSKGEQTQAAKIEHLIRKPLSKKLLDGFAYEEEKQEDVVNPRTQKRRIKKVGERKASKEKKESPFTKTGKVKSRYRVDDPEEALKKKKSRRVRMKKKLPHQR